MLHISHGVTVVCVSRREQTVTAEMTAQETPELQQSDLIWRLHQQVLKEPTNNSATGYVGCVPLRSTGQFQFMAREIRLGHV